MGPSSLGRNARRWKWRWSVPPPWLLLQQTLKLLQLILRSPTLHWFKEVVMEKDVEMANLLKMEMMLFKKMLVPGDARRKEWSVRRLRLLLTKVWWIMLEDLGKEIKLSDGVQEEIKLRITRKLLTGGSVAISS